MFKFNNNKINSVLKRAASFFEKNKKYKTRLTLNKWGEINITYNEISSTSKKAKVILSKINRCNSEKFLYNKTTHRPWEKEFTKAKQKGFDEVLFINENNELLEGAITNLIIEKNKKLFTPPITLAILNGCYRQFFLENNKCEEKVLTVDDLTSADKIFLCNSIRKEITVERIFNWDEELKYHN